MQPKKSATTYKIEESSGIKKKIVKRKKHGSKQFVGICQVGLI